MPSKLTKLLIKQRKESAKMDQLSTDSQTLLGFLTLIVDIQYRNKYGVSFEEQRGKGYSENVQFNKVLADQVSPVDDGLLGISQRELLGL